MKLGQAARIAKGGDWVLSRYHEYAAHRDQLAEGQKIVEIMQLPRRREGTWSASGAGTCPRARQFTYLGMPQVRPDEKSMNIFANGDYVHLRHQAFGLVAGYVTAVEVPVSLPELSLSGTMDGVLINDAILEIKSINTRGFSQVTTFGVKPDHQMQVTAYMLAADRSTAHVIYEDKNTQQLKELVVHLQDELAEQVLAELTALNQATAAEQLLPMLKECRNEEGRFRWCPYAPICEYARWPREKSQAPRRLLLIRPTSSSAND